jgi:anaerobic dimethyl sulfoxide reductase subunit C (anchor subunit)
MAIQWTLVFFALLTGLGVGVFSCIAVIEWLGIGDVVLLPGTITALAAMAAGGLASVFHLSHPLRAHNIVKHLETGVGKEMLLITVTGVAILLYALIRLTGLGDLPGKIVAAVGLVAGIVLAFEMGATYVLPARPAWRTWLWSFIYAASAVVSGIFAVYVWAALFQGRVNEALVMGINKGALIALIVQVGVVLAYLFYLDAAPGEDPIKKPSRLLKGAGALPFWGGVVFAGMVIPIALTIWFQAAQSIQYSRITAVIGLIGVLSGGIAIRALMYTLGDEIDPIF